ncbi:OsmC family protein [Georgenia sp. Z1491]|uniref:OsmC family protein n=1 Tax=Georgenia sp. Z1491 TaxID=3416707 RepID=UPI003CE8FD12
MSGLDYSSAVTVCTTAVRGRFTVQGEGFALLADGSVATGGPGRAPGPLDLLVSALTVNLVNTLRSGASPDADPEDDLSVQVRARTTRYHRGRIKAGRLLVEVVVAGLDEIDTAALVERYREGCRILPAVETVLDVEIRSVPASAMAA